MDVDRDTVVEIAVSVGTVALFIAVVVAIGDTYNQGGLSTDGGMALVGAIAGFVVVMSLLGIGLAHYLNR